MLASGRANLRGTTEMSLLKAFAELMALMSVLCVGLVSGTAVHTFTGSEWMSWVAGIVGILLSMLSFGVLARLGDEDSEEA